MINLESLLKIALTGVVVAILMLLFKGIHSPITSLICVAGSLALLAAIIGMADGAIDAVKDLLNDTKIENESIKNILKITGAAFIADFSATLCRDMGEGTVASKIEMAGRIYIILLAVPWATMLIEAVKALGG